MATLTSLKQMLSSSENNDLREVSFSSYSSSTDENLHNFVGKLAQPVFIGKLEQPSRNPAPYDDHQENETDNHFSRRKKQEDGEIGVFRAEKYFNGVIQQVDHSPRISRFNIPNKYDIHHVIKEEMYLPTPPKPKLHPSITTPTSARSESSWNSQNALLHHKSQSHSQASQPESKIKIKKNNYRKSFLAGLGCNCMCSDSGSVDVEHEQLGEINSSKKKGDEIVENMEKQRKSLQVFGSPLQDQKKGNSFRMLTTTSGFVNIEDEDEDDSDGRSSSDLFEIESITGKGNPAPSEASIEWSVVTASAADFSVISDYDDIIIGPNHKTASGAGDMKRRGGISLGCKTGKAVSVADRIISNDQAVRRVSDTYMPPLPMKFPSVNNKIMEFDSTPTQRVMSLPRSQHNSHLFYIH